MSGAARTRGARIWRDAGDAVQALGKVEERRAARVWCGSRRLAARVLLPQSLGYRSHWHPIRLTTPARGQQPMIIDRETFTELAVHLKLASDAILKTARHLA